MEPGDREELRQLIEQRINEIKASMPYLEQETEVVEPSVSLGRLTRMEALNDKGVNEQVLEQNRRRLERLHNAMPRVETDQLGRCVRCGTEIPIERLRLVPEALFCAPCADKKR